jgi:hypothetical protein
MKQELDLYHAMTPGMPGGLKTLKQKCNGTIPTTNLSRLDYFFVSAGANNYYEVLMWHLKIAKK